MSDLIRKICDNFEISEQSFVRLCSSAPRKYKKFRIPKKSGGYRSLAQPAKSLKNVQRWLVENYFVDFPVHPSATAYIQGVGIRHNARVHAANKYLYKFDFRDFFPSIKPNDFQFLVAKNDIGINSYEAELVSRLIFWTPSQGKGLELSVGAPSSPIISNAIMFEFDCRLNNFCVERGVAYTRYADDVCLSGNDKVSVKEAAQFFKKLVFETNSPKLTVNREKTIFVNEKSPKKITGLAITPDGRISAGRKLKRKVRALVHQYRLGQLSNEDERRLKGYINYLRDVEPDFVEKINPEGLLVWD